MADNAILTIEKPRYLHNRLGDIGEILHGHAYRPKDPSDCSEIVIVIFKNLIWWTAVILKTVKHNRLTDLVILIKFSSVVHWLF